MKPGRGLDALAAEKVMGWVEVRESAPGDPLSRLVGHDPQCIGAPVYFFTIPAYSTDISAVWEVVEKLKEKNIRLELSPLASGYSASFVRYTPDIDPDFNCLWTGIGNSYSEAETAPHAICLAAIKSCGHGMEA